MITQSRHCSLVAMYFYLARHIATKTLQTSSLPFCQASQTLSTLTQYDMARKKKQQAATGEMQATTESPKDQTDLLSAALRGLRLENVASQTATDDKAPRTQRIHTDNNGNDTKKSSQQHQLQSEPPISSRTRSVTKARTDGLKPVKKTIKMHSQPKQFLLPRPRPTPQYLQQASQPPRLTEEPRRLLIILDLNGTLVHRKGRHVTSSFTKRPHCKDFIK